MWIILLVLVLVVLVVWIALPLAGVRRSWAPMDHKSIEEQLQAERGRLLRALKDLEFEREAESLGDDEYQELRADYLAETAAVYRRLEEIGARPEEATR